jgi:hypothetical protein
MPRQRAKSADQKSLGDAGDDGNGGSTAQTASGLRGTPPSAIVRAVPELIWGMSDYMTFR